MRIRDFIDWQYPNQRALGRKEDRKSVERTLKRNVPFVGDIYEVLNNLIDSEDNLEEAIDPLARLTHFVSDLTVDEALHVFRKGDHIATMRLLYSHHGIYDGHGGVFEYNEGQVRHSRLSQFADGDKLYCVDEDTIYSREQIVSRAISRLGEEDYNLLYNNCDNFATWCRLGN